MGLVKLVFSILGVLILAVVGLAAYLYFTDYEVQGEVTEKEGNVITIRPKLLARDFQYELDSNTAQFVCEGYQVRYAVRSGHYTVSDRDGRPVYDSDEGLTDAFTPTRCALLGA